MRRLAPLLLLVLGLAAAAYFAFRPPARPDNLNASVQSTPQVIEGFARAEGPRELSFPADFGPHPDFQTEWWYYTGNLETADGRHFGYQLTFFRRGLLPPSQLPPRGSQWATGQVYMAHFTITDVQASDFYATERFSRGAAGLAGAQGEPYAVWLEDWRVEATGPDTFSLYAANEGLHLELSLHDAKGPILQGDRGYSRKGEEPGNASYYYSQTRLLTEGRLTIGDETFQLSGLSWKDHEFSTSVLTSEIAGWDWFSLQLNNGYELMLYQLRAADGSVLPRSSGTLVAPDGSTTQLFAGDFVLTPLSQWRSPHSGAEYPASWRISLPAHNLQLEVTPYLSDQELLHTFTYWEGAVRISGSQGGQSVSGSGYVELTGYAEPFNGDF